MLKVRYHLLKGPYHGYWQFKDTKTKEVFYHKPSDKIIKIYDCILHNNRRVAEKIFIGKNKDVCSWVKFSKMEFVPDMPSICTHIRYNPKVLPYWHIIYSPPNSPPVSRNLDGEAFDELYLCEKGVFFNSCRDIEKGCRLR